MRSGGLFSGSRTELCIAVWAGVMVMNFEGEAIEIDMDPSDSSTLDIPSPLCPYHPFILPLSALAPVFSLASPDLYNESLRKP